MFSPGFQTLVGGTTSGATIDSAPGHVVITFVNNAEVDEQLLAYLEGNGDLMLDEAEKRALRPRVRFRVRVTFADESEVDFEFVGGSVNLIDQRFDAQSYPDLNQNDMKTAVVVCDVTAVEVAPETAIEVFIPVALIAYAWEPLTDIQGDVTRGTWVFAGAQLPTFWPLATDLVDNDFNTLQVRNIGIRDAPAPVEEARCGSVIAIVMDGTLTAPFLLEATNDPSYDEEDQDTIARIGGRYEFTVTVQ